MLIETNEFYYAEWRLNGGINFGYIYVTDIKDIYVGGRIEYTNRDGAHFGTLYHIEIEKLNWSNSNLKRKVNIAEVEVHAPKLYQWYLKNIHIDNSILIKCL